MDEGSRIRIDFTKDMQPGEVGYYESLLPMHLNKDRRGSTILLYAPDDFMAWLGEKPGEEVQARGNRRPERSGFRGWLLQKLGIRRG